ncbi:hypothetical protein BGX38DRAFT_1189550 [Terfezia claveryi]|nr:hypothetical protein BGX38DRAFT_1189550 [Terfezia claveryi]
MLTRDVAFLNRAKVAAVVTGISTFLSDRQTHVESGSICAWGHADLVLHDSDLNVENSEYYLLIGN